MRLLPLQRLKTRQQFQAVLNGVALAVKTKHFTLHQLDTTQSDTDAIWSVANPNDTHLIGALIPKKWARRAVTRNTIRRQVYAVSSEYLPNRQCVVSVVRLHATFSRSAFLSCTSNVLKRAVRQELVELFVKANWASLEKDTALPRNPL